MPTYINPLALETPNGWKAQGALGGFLAGMNQDLANQMVGQSMQETNLDMATKQQALDQARAMQQDKIDEADALAAKARQDAQYYSNGDYGNVLASNAKTTLAGNDLKQTQDQVEQQLAPAKLYQQMSAEMQQIAPNGLDPMNPDHVSWYDSWYKRLKQFTPNMPQMIQPDTSGVINKKGMQAQQFIQAVGTNPDFQNKMALAKQAQTATHDTSTEVAQINADSRQAVADARAQAMRDVQAAKNEKDQLSKKMDEADTKVIERARKDGVIDDVVRGAVERQGLKDAQAALKDNMDYLFADDNTKKSMLDAVTKQAMERILPGSTQSGSVTQTSSKDNGNGPTQWAGQGTVGTVYMTPKGPGRYKGMRNGKPVFERP